MRQTSVDLGSAGWDPVFGSGRIDANAAVAAARAYQRPAPPPPPPPAPRRAIKFVWSCSAGSATVLPGRRTYARFAVKTKVLCKGRTVPALRNARVYVQRFAAKRGWKTIGSFKTNSRGRFGFARRLNTTGGWTLRPFYPGATVLLPSAGAGVKVKAVRR